MNKVARLN